MKEKQLRLEDFRCALVSDPAIPVNAMEAYGFLRKHLDAVELAELPAKYHQDFTTRMLIPSFETPGAWVRNGSFQEWKAFAHLIRISDTGQIIITTNSGELWFIRP